MIDNFGTIQRLAGDIADRHPDSETHEDTQRIIEHATELAHDAREEAEVQLSRANHHREQRQRAEVQRDRLAAYASDLERGGVSLGHIKRARAKHLHDGDMEGLG